MEETELERKFKEIMDSDELPLPAGASKEKIREIFSGLDERSQRILAKLLREGMITPEEIEQSKKNAVHNAEIQARRDERLAMRRARQARQTKRG